VRDEQRSGLKAGFISGIAWAALMTAATVSEIGLNYSAVISNYDNYCNANATACGGLTGSQYVTQSVEFNSLITIIVGVAFGLLVGYMFIMIASRFLVRQTYIVKGVIISAFLWLLYELGLTGFSDVYQLLTSLAVSLFSGYLLGFLYTRYSGPPPQLVGEETDYSTNAGGSGGNSKSGSRGRSQP
jgi:hypothetical protein